MSPGVIVRMACLLVKGWYLCEVMSHPGSGWCHCVGGMWKGTDVIVCIWCGAVTGSVCGLPVYFRWSIKFPSLNRMVLLWVCSWPLSSDSASSHWRLLMPLKYHVCDKFTYRNKSMNFQIHYETGNWWSLVVSENCNFSPFSHSRSGMM